MRLGWGFDKKNKRAAEQNDKTVRRITEFIKPKPEQISIPANDENNSVPGAARAGSLDYNLGSEENFIGGIRKQNNMGEITQPANGVIRKADFDWTDGTRGPD